MYPILTQDGGGKHISGVVLDFRIGFAQTGWSKVHTNLHVPREEVYNR